MILEASNVYFLAAGHLGLAKIAESKTLLIRIGLYFKETVTQVNFGMARRFGRN
jgi:hypothetical protein